MRLLISLCLATSVLIAQAGTGQKYNVLLIAVDDLRPELGCYGSEVIYTPNMDRLANEGVLFERAYCQEAICMASRASLLTGLYPEPVNGYNFRTRVDQGLPGIPNLPEYFRNNGYYTVGINKIYHHYWEEKKNWDENHESPTPGSDWRNYVTTENQRIQQSLWDESKRLLGDKSRFNINNRPAAMSYEIAPDELAENYVDSHGTKLALEKIRELKDKPFFLAMGYRRPHLPFNAPESFFEMYPLEDVELPENMYYSEGASVYVRMNSQELRAYSDIPEEGPAVGTIRKAKELIRAYFASVSYVDDLIGQLLDELEVQGLRDNTIVLLFGDHGFKLGEHNEWCKHSNFEIDVRSPLIISAPLFGKEVKTDALVEFVDIYPTLVELCGLPKPDHLEGESLLPVLENGEASHKEFAMSRYPRDNNVLGHSIRLEDFRYTQWVDNRNGRIVGEELFDHRVDSDENVNVVNHPENADVVRKCRDLIEKKLKEIQEKRSS